MTTERTVYLSYLNGAVAHGHRERQVSVPWCVVHNSSYSIGAGWDDEYGPGMCDKVAWTTDDEGKMCNEGVVWRV